MIRVPRFSLRVFLITIALVILFGGSELYRQSRQSDAASTLRSIPNTYVGFDYDLKSSSEWKDRLPPVRSTLAGLVRRTTGSDLFNPVLRLWLTFDFQNPTSLSQVGALSHLQWLHLAPSGTISRDGVPCPPLSALSGCSQLNYLVLGSWVDLTPNGSHGFAGTGTTLLPLNVNASHLSNISHITTLRILATGGSGLTDKSVDDLAKLSQLEYLYLSRTQISPEGMNRLQRLLPNVTIIELTDNSRDYAEEINSRF